MRFKTIYADPPWYERGGGRIKRGADRHYKLMTTERIKAYPVREMADDNCHLYLWATNNHLRDAFEVMDAWGFRYVTMITWIKDKQGLGQYFRGITEHCLFGVKGRLPYKTMNNRRCQGVTGFYEPRRGHSVKPEKMREMIEAVSYEPRIELFARSLHKGWYADGDEVAGENLPDFD